MPSEEFHSEMCYWKGQIIWFEMETKAAYSNASADLTLTEVCPTLGQTSSEHASNLLLCL